MFDLPSGRYLELRRQYFMEYFPNFSLIIEEENAIFTDTKVKSFHKQLC